MTKMTKMMSSAGTTGAVDETTRAVMEPRRRGDEARARRRLGTGPEDGLLVAEAALASALAELTE